MLGSAAKTHRPPSCFSRSFVSIPSGTCDRRLPYGTLSERLDFLPEFLPLFAFRFGQPGQALGTAHAGQILVLEPVLHLLGDRGAGLVRVFLHQLPIRFQIGAQPVQGLLTQTGAFLVVEFVRIFALIAPRESGGAAGVVAELSISTVSLPDRA